MDILEVLNFSFQDQDITTLELEHGDLALNVVDFVLFGVDFMIQVAEFFFVLSESVFRAAEQERSRFKLGGLSAVFVGFERSTVELFLDAFDFELELIHLLVAFILDVVDFGMSDAVYKLSLEVLVLESNGLVVLGIYDLLVYASKFIFEGVIILVELFGFKHQFVGFLFV